MSTYISNHKPATESEAWYRLLGVAEVPGVELLKPERVGLISYLIQRGVSFQANAANAIIVRGLEDPAERAVARELWRQRRAVWRVEQTLLQRHWQTHTSRRPSRGRNHDSWSIREKYVRLAA